MTTTPDPQTVREIARKHIQSGMTLDVGTTIVKHFGSGALSDEEFWAWEYEVENARRAAKVTVSWPDEQPQDERDAPMAMRVLRNAYQHLVTLDQEGHAMISIGNVLELLNAENFEFFEDDEAQGEQDGDVRVIAELLGWVRRDYERDRMRDGAIGFSKLAAFELHFADRIAALEARDAKAGE